MELTDTSKQRLEPLLREIPNIGIRTTQNIPYQRFGQPRQIIQSILPMEQLREFSDKPDKLYRRFYCCQLCEVLQSGGDHIEETFSV